MSSGNLLSAIESKFNESLTVQRIAELYHLGQLSSLLPDDCYWLILIDIDRDVQSIEWRRVTDNMPPLLSVHPPSGGELAVLCDVDVSTDYRAVQISQFPLCELEKRLAPTKATIHD